MDVGQISSSIFDQAVARYFIPIATKHGWPVIHSSDDSYEISAPTLIMRITFGSGHGKSIAATIRSAEKFDNNTDGSSEFGVAVIAAYNGSEIRTKQVSTVEEFFEQAEYIARMAGEFCVPYMLGKPLDLTKVGEFIKAKSADDMKKIRNYRFPPNVQKRWHLPKDKS